MILQKVISGGQIGADQAGLFAAKGCWIATGGWAPKGWMTQDGPNLSLGYDFGLQEHPRKGYPPRTFANVKDSDGTIRFAADFNSRGELCTLKAIKQYSKPFLNVALTDTDMSHVQVEHITQFLLDNEIKVVNIAGNSTRTHPGIYDFTYQLLVKAFLKLK